MEEVKKRIEEIDMVKGIVIILVTFMHVSSYCGAIEWSFAKGIMAHIFSESIMILFMIISGYLFSKKGTCFYDIKYRLKQLLIPSFVCLIIFSFLYFVRYVMIEHISINEYFIHFFQNLFQTCHYDIFSRKVVHNYMAYAFDPLWYICEISTAYFLFIPIFHYLENKTQKIKWVFAIILLFIAMIFAKLDIQNLSRDLYNSAATYFFIIPNIFGFSAMLLIGSILRENNLFDVEKIPKNKRNSLAIIFFVIYLFLCVNYDNYYALQYGIWGQYGVLSIPITTFAAIILSFSLICLCFYLKKCQTLKNIFSFCGKNSLDILLIHCGVAEIICYIGGFWFDIYGSESYPKELFSYWNWGLAVVLTFVITIITINVKRRIKSKL